MSEARTKAVEIHDRDAEWFEDQYAGRNVDPAFVYGREFIDAELDALLDTLPRGGGSST